MDFSLLLKYVNVVFRELWQRKFLCLFGFAAVSFIVLVIGIYWPSKFETTATIFADNQNILKPLLSNQAEQSRVQDQSKIVADMIHSPRLLKRVAEQLYSAEGFDSAEDLGKKISNLRKTVSVSGLGSSYIKVSYTDKTAEEAYRVINTVIDEFIKTSSDEQRSESREAFMFIDNQVKQYKDQLLLAEERLKAFRAGNFDGRDVDVDARISSLRDQLEQLKISIDEGRTTMASLEKQLANETEYSSKKVKADAYSIRLEELVNRKNALLLTYTEDYPDVISLTYQIDDIRKAIKEAQLMPVEPSSKSVAEDEPALNPLYQELRSRLSFIQADLKAKEKRQIALNDLLALEFERRKRIAERGADEAELTRDYNVTKRIYEDMLERKEKARLSMTLNIEGQGVTYRIQEPALPPLHPVGLRFLHFVAAGPFVGLFAVLGLLVLYVLLDPRVRFPEQLQDFGVATLAVVPHVKTPFTRRVVRMDLIICIFLGSLIMAAYIGLAYMSKIGLI